MHHRSKRRAVCSSSARITTAFFLSFLAISAFAPSALAKQTDQEIAAPVLPVIPVPEPDSDPMMDGSDRADGQIFTLKHLFHHGLDEYPDLHRRLDIESGATVFVETEDGVRETAASFRARAQSLKIQRLTDRRPSTIEPILAAARNGAEMQSLSADFWTMDELPGPNVTDKETVLNLAIMSANSYVAEPGTGKWLDIGQHVNHSSSFGWEKDGLRGHIFADPTNSTIIMSIKGTSVAVFDGAETTTNDKENDNLLFGCCCGSGGPWAQKQACDCYLSTYTCNQTCLEGSLRQENRYYRAVLDLYSNVTELYPESEVWLTGHSLGGAVNALLALTYGLPVVTFEAPGDALAAARLGLPSPPGSDPDMPQTRKDTGAFHFGHTADPIFMGVCNGATSACSLGGYALETACHTGKECIYDVVTDKGWRVGLGTHSILQVINDVIKVYDDVPSCEPNEACYDCTNWKFPKSNSSDSSTSTSTSTSTTRTRTSTCKTPGWWGCLDETTTTTTDTSSSTSTSETTTTSSCKTPGWFGCNDPTTTVSSAVPAPTITTTSAPTFFVSSTESSSTCQHPGWFGRCKDPSPTSVPSKSSAVPSTSCHTPGLLWGCRDHSATITKPPSLKPSTNLEL